MAPQHAAAADERRGDAELRSDDVSAARVDLP
jgi:hypothetical protein